MPSQSSSAQTPSRDISSARITSIIAIAVSTRIRVASGASGADGVDVPVEVVVPHQLGDRPRLGEHLR